MVMDIERMIAGLDAAIPVIPTLAASLFSARGKLPVKVVAMSDAGAMILCADHPPGGSFAFLVRNGVKLPATIASTDETHLELHFEATPDAGRRQELFRSSRRRPAGPVGDIVFAHAPVINPECQPLHDACG